MYIYALLKNDIPFYVGRTAHLKNRLNTHKKKYGNDISIKEIDSCDYNDSVELESYYIKQYLSKGYRLNKQINTTTDKQRKKLNKYLLNQKQKRTYKKRYIVTKKYVYEPEIQISDEEKLIFIEELKVFLGLKP